MDLPVAERPIILGLHEEVCLLDAFDPPVREHVLEVADLADSPVLVEHFEEAVLTEPPVFVEHLDEATLEEHFDEEGITELHLEDLV